MSAGHDDRTSHTQRVGRGACWRRHDESVSLIGSQRLAIDGGMDGNHRSVVALQDGHVVQRTGIALQRLAVGLHLYDRARLDAVVVDKEGSYGVLYVAGVDVCQKAQASHVDAQDGNLLLPHHAGGTQEGTVTTHRDGEVGLKVMTVEDAHTLDRHLLPVSQELVESPFHQHLRLALHKAGQYLLDRYRLLGLVGVAEDGKPKFSCRRHFLSLFSLLFAFFCLSLRLQRYEKLM